MEWWLVLLLILGSLMVLFATKMPVAFCFLLVNFVAAFLLWGKTGPEQVIISFKYSVGTFSMVPIPLFILMGTALFYSGIAPLMIAALDRWLGRLPARLSLLCVVAGTIIATLTGASMAAVAILGSSLLPEMEKRGYKTPMTLGPIMGSGGLAMLIPPSAMAVFIGVVGEISVGKLLIGSIIPGLIVAALMAAYIVVRARLRPDLAPSYEAPPMTFREKIIPSLQYVLPMGIIIFLVTGVMFLGIATPTEAAATGALGTFLVAAAYRKLSWDVAKKSIIDSLETSLMLLLIIVGATAFSQILAFTHASSGMSKFAAGLSVSPLVILVLMLVVGIVLGMFMPPGAIIMVTFPLFMPIVRALHFSDVWFGVLWLLNMELAQISPPFGMNLFVMRSVAQRSTMKEVYVQSLPYCFIDLVAMALIIALPQTALWLPGLMR